jgi:glycosyltransferase involved in cell wall biosynthesis
MNPLSWAAAGRRVQEIAPDVTIIQWWLPFFGPCLGKIASMARKRSKVIFLCHNIFSHEKMPIARTLVMSALKHGDGFVVHSRADEKNLAHLMPGVPVRRTVLPEFDLCPAEGIAKSEARRRLGLTGPTVLFFGLVRKYKGLMDLIEAMALVKMPDLTCLIAGEFYDRKQKYTSRIEQLGLGKRIRMIDRYLPNEEVEQYFAASDAVILPYRTATQSAVLQLACRFERPVIATNAGGLPESIDDGCTGLLVPVGDPGSLAHAIERFYREDLEQSLVQGICQDRDRFSWRRMVETIESLAKEAKCADDLSG